MRYSMVWHPRFDSDLLHVWLRQTLRQIVGSGEKRGHYGGDGGENGATFQVEPFPLDRRFASERPGAVKGAPLLGAAKRTLDGEDRSGSIQKEGKAPWSGARSGPLKVPLRSPPL